MKTITFKSPCKIGDTIYYVWTRRKNNKYTFKMKKRVACGFVIKDFQQYVCVKDKSGADMALDTAVDFLMEAYENREQGQLFVCESGVRCSIEDIAKRVCEECGVEMKDLDFEVV